MAVKHGKNYIEGREEAFRTFHNDNKTQLEKAGDALENLLSAILAANDGLSGFTVTNRLKDREESISKFNRKYREKLVASGEPYDIRDHITDLIGLRVVCHYEQESPLIRDILTKDFELIDATDKTAQLEEKEDAFGYKGLHLDLKLKAPRSALQEYQLAADYPFEVQIRTIIQDAWSVLDHQIKYKKSIPTDIKRRINALAAQFESADKEFQRIRNSAAQWEEEAAQSVAAEESVPLNVFGFKKTIDRFFPNYRLSATAIDGFVNEILELHPKITTKAFQDALRNHLSTIVTFENKSPALTGKSSLAPLTKVRFALYASDSERFKGMLWDYQADNFDAWRKS